MRLPPKHTKTTLGRVFEPLRQFGALTAAIGMACLLAASAGGEVKSQTSECFPIPAFYDNDTDAIANAIKNHSCAKFKANTTYWIDGRLSKFLRAEPF